MRRTLLISRRVLIHIALIALSFVSVFPVYWMIISSLKGPGEIYQPTLFPLQMTFENYRYAFESINMLKMTANSLIIVLAQVTCQLATGILAAYALVRWEFKAKGLVFVLLSLSWVIPFQIIMIPNYVVVNRIGLNGTLIAIILPSVASAFVILSLYQSLKAFPLSLIDAARMDGQKDLGILFKIILPNVKATVASLAIILFINAWNDYMWPMLITSKNMDIAPIQIGLKSFVGAERNTWGSLMAASTVTCIPILIAYFALQRQVVDSFAKFGLK